MGKKQQPISACPKQWAPFTQMFKHPGQQRFGEKFCMGGRLDKFIFEASSYWVTDGGDFLGLTLQALFTQLALQGLGSRPWQLGGSKATGRGEEQEGSLFFLLWEWRTRKWWKEALGDSALPDQNWVEETLPFLSLFPFPAPKPTGFQRAQGCPVELKGEAGRRTPLLVADINGASF